MNKKPNHSRAARFFKFVWGNLLITVELRGFRPKTNNKLNHNLKTTYMPSAKSLKREIKNSKNMENYVFDEDSDSTEKVLEEGQESSEEGFMRGYSDEEETKECAECGSAVNEENKIEKEVEGEKITFCSENCAEEFVENL